MAASGYTPISLYYSTTTTNTPSAGNLVNGELAINITDGKLFYKDNNGVVQVIATKGTGPIGGSNTQVQYNSSGSLAGSANHTFDGTTLTLGNAGVSSRFQGDFSNATFSSRTAFQTGTTNGTTGIYALPNGTSTAASWQATNNSDPTNASKILIATNGSTDVQLVSGINGTGTYLPLSFYTNGSQQMRLDTSGNLGLGVNPSAWNSGFKVLQIGSKTSVSQGNSADAILGSNYYNNVSNSPTYLTSSYATAYSQNAGDGTHKWFYSVSGTAGNTVTFTEAMRIDNSGNVGIGTSSPNAKLDVRGNIGLSDGSSLVLSDGTYTYPQILNNQYIAGTGDVLTIQPAGNASSIIAYKTGGSERMRIDSSGNVGIGVTSPGSKLGVLSSTNAWGIRVATTYGTNDSGFYFDGSGNSQCAMRDSAGNNSYITNTSNNMQFATGGTERMRIDSSGRLLVGTTTPYDTNSIATFSNSHHGMSAVTTATDGGWYTIECGRTGSTGKFIGFTYPGPGTEVGSVSYNGTLTLYNATSDQRLKENIVDAETAFETINQIKIRSFDWIESKVHETHGVIAQELQQIAPQCVTEGTTNEDGSMGSPWQVDTSPLIPLLIKSIQELKSIVDTQAERIAVLQAQVATLQGAK